MKYKIKIQRKTNNSNNHNIYSNYKGYNNWKHRTLIKLKKKKSFQSIFFKNNCIDSVTPTVEHQHSILYYYYTTTQEYVSLESTAISVKQKSNYRKCRYL